jgi:hypothetical protein
VEAWYRVPCPRCGGLARRETDVSDTFLDSAWYFLRYPSAGRHDVPFERELTKRWLPVAMYIGGEEYAVLHLLYSRFVTMALEDLGHLDFEEPYIKDGAEAFIDRVNAMPLPGYLRSLIAPVTAPYCGACADGVSIVRKQQVAGPRPRPRWKSDMAAAI